MLLLEVQSRIDELQIGAERLKEKGMLPRVSLCHIKVLVKYIGKDSKNIYFCGDKNDRTTFQLSDRPIY